MIIKKHLMKQNIIGYKERNKMGEEKKEVIIAQKIINIEENLTELLVIWIYKVLIDSNIKGRGVLLLARMIILL